MRMHLVEMWLSEKSAYRVGFVRERKEKKEIDGLRGRRVRKRRRSMERPRPLQTDNNTV
jgi:hypothetical protein